MWSSGTMASGDAKQHTQEDKEHYTRSQSTKIALSTSGVLPNICIFCKKARKKYHGREEKLFMCRYDSCENTVKGAARELNDADMIVLIGDIDFHSKEVQYHESCKRAYLNKNRDTLNTKTKMSCKEDTNSIALSNIYGYIETSVIDNQRPEYLVSLHRQYCKFLEQISQDETVPHKVCTLGDKIVQQFGNRVSLDCASKKEGLVIYSSKTNKKLALSLASKFSTSEEHIINEAACLLRSNILEACKSAPELPASLSLEDFMKGQVETPGCLRAFFTTLLCGKSKDNEDEVPDSIKRRVDSLSQDVIFCTSRGRVKPSKQLCMGVGMKSLTGSRRVIEILNHMGHSIGYHMAESIETEIASSIVADGKVLPDLLLPQVGLSTGLAWDNYDELTETLSGRDTLHDTVGICYQNMPAEVVEAAHTVEAMDIDDTSTTSKPSSAKRRRTFDAPDRTIVPYKRMPSLSKFDFEIYSKDPPPSLERAKKMDVIWSICCHLMSNTPMWRGWNSLVFEDTLPLQKIGYMENIELPPTRLDVVVETLLRSQKVASECGETYAIVTYDLAIAKPALQIQAQESPRFDNVFVCFGAFHICMAYFSALGYIIESSGCTDVLCSAEVLAHGSVRGFIAGKHFNRCRRIHPLFALSLQILHFKQFLTRSGISDACVALLNSFAAHPSPHSLSTLLESSVICDMFERYSDFCNQTRQGHHGTNGRFWFIYIDLVHNYMLFDRASRMTDEDLYTYALGLLCPLFFATHKPNYARWMSLYHLNLLNMDMTHPGIRSSFQRGALSIRRSRHTFSRSAVDITLEQTVNRDAASRQGGIAAFTQNVSARKRWTVTRSFRGAVVGCLLEMAGITAVDDCVQELKPSRITRDNDDLKNTMKELENTLNPFSIDDKKLYCLSTGKPASNDVTVSLLELEKTGSAWHQAFVNECRNDGGRFAQAIKRRKVMNFTHDAVKVKFTTKDKQIKEAKCTRDIFGRLLFLSLTQGLDLTAVLTFPLTPVPLSLCHITGDMNKTSKCTLMDTVEAMGTSDNMPVRTDAYIIDTMFFLRTLSMPATYGGMAMYILKQACSNGQVVHIVSDTYPDGPNIKDIEHDMRGGTKTSFKISGPSQKRTSDLNAAWSSPQFKKDFLIFLRDEWNSETYASVLKGHQVYFAVEQECYLYTVERGSVKRSQIHELQSEHQEADTRMVFHANFVAETSDEEPVIVLRCNDTDVFVLLIHHVRHIKARIWMDAGLGSKNNRRLIDILDLATQLTPTICEALPGFHALTGCDYTASFMRKAKKMPFEIMMKNPRFTAAIKHIGDADVLDPDVAAVVEEYVCAVYGVQHLRSVNEARHYKFNKMYAPKKESCPLDKIKTTDPCCMPPCQRVLHQKLLRTNFVAYMWRNAREAQPVMFGPEGHGWKTDGNRLSIAWFIGSSVPDKLTVEETDLTTEDDESEDKSTCSSDEEEDIDSD